MNINIIIVGAVLLLLSIVPMIVINKKKNNKQKRFVQALHDLAEKNRYKISEFDTFNDIAIGIDKDARQLFFLRKTPGHELQQHTGLTEFKKCRLSVTSRVVGGGSDQKIVDKLELTFSHQDSPQKGSVLELYNTDYDNLTMTGELQMAEKWVEIINNNLSTQMNNQVYNKKNLAS